MADGIIYEPRSIWDLQRAAAGETELVFDREHLMNGTRHPITLRRMAISPIGYILRRVSRGINAPTAQNSWNGLHLINELRIRITAPFRQHYSRYEIRLPGYQPRPRWPAPVAATYAAAYASCLLGTSRLDFDHPLVVPRTAGLEFSMTGYLLPTGYAPADPTTRSRASVLWQEAGGSFAGAGRYRAGQLVAEVNPAVEFNPDSPVPLPPDGMGANSGAGFSTDPWANGHFTAADFKAQDDVRQGTAKLTGLAVHIDQIDYDAAIDALGAPFAGWPVAPNCLRVGTRVRSEVVGEWWWRPGAPMGLVLDTITPALVYELPEPITLGPGDSLNVRAELPGTVAVSNPEGGTDNVNPVINLGIAFNGEAAIEG